jgi:hypothetical protein
VSRANSAAVTLAANAMAPRLSHRLRWHTRLGVAGTLVYTGASAAAAALFVWSVDCMARRQETLRAAARAELGHEPTADELFEYAMRAKAE